MDRSKLIEAIFENMQQMHRSSTGKFQMLTKECGITLSQMELLLLVKHSGPLSVKDIAAYLHLTPGAVTQMLEHLEQQSYVAREASPEDRRITNVSLTDGGRKKLRSIWERRTKTMQDIVQTLETDELAVWLRVQEKMLRHMNKQADEQAHNEAPKK